MQARNYLIIYALLALLLPVMIILSNAGFFLGFADAAEFALVTKVAGIAHPPGFPAYVLTGFGWSQITSLFGMEHITSMVLFSVACTAIASLLYFHSACRLLAYIYDGSMPVALLSLTAAVSFCTGVTAWHWSSNVEVYSFQVLAFSILIYGLVEMSLHQKSRGIYIAAAGAAFGLANHHLTMILFLPFCLLFFYEPLLTKVVKTKKNVLKKKFQIRKLIIFSAAAMLFTVPFYSWMYFRAQADLPFKFGNPDSADRLLYHLAGGAWLKNTQSSVKGIVSLRFPYFMNLVAMQFLLFLPLVAAGWMETFRKKFRPLIYITAGYFTVMLMYQLRIDQVSDTDAYMLPSFFVLSLLIPFGFAAFFKWSKKFIYIIPLLLIIQFSINYRRTDKRAFNVNEALMEELNRSTPQNSILLIADWTTVIQYYYHRIAENFRSDLYVLNYDLKFTNYKIFPVLYPELYKKVKNEYDAFINILGMQHPQEIYNTGCTLDSRELMDAYMNVVLKLKQIAAHDGVPFMCDPKAYVFLNQYGVMSNKEKVSGPFVSTLNTGKGEDFLRLDYRWLDAPLLLHEPAATDKLVDLEAALDFNRNYYKGTSNEALLQQAEQSYQRIKSLQRKMKRNMPFVYRP